MLKGVKALFCAGLALLDHLKPQLMIAEDLGKLNSFPLYIMIFCNVASIF